MKRTFDPIYIIMNPTYDQPVSGGGVIEKPTVPSGTTMVDGAGNEYVYFTVDDDGVSQDGWYTMNDSWDYVFVSEYADSSWTPLP